MSDTVRRVVLCRHATAENPPGVADDERPLADAGIEEAARLAAWLKDGDLLGDLVVCSPALRTRQTWATIEEESGRGVVIAMEPALYEAGVDDLVRVLRELDATHPEARSVVLVGHAPGVPATAYDLAGGDGDARALEVVTRGFVPASAAVVEFEGSWADLGPGRGRLVAARRGDEE